MISLDQSVIYQIILFVVLWLILSRVLFRPYQKLLEEREHKTAGALHESSDLEREAERLKSQYEDKIAQAERAGSAAKDQIVQQARQQRERVITQAREEAAAALEAVRRDIQAQLQRERQIAARESVTLARELASKILGRSVA